MDPERRSADSATCRSLGCLDAVDRDGAGLDAWDEFPPKLHRVVQRLEAADEERVDSKSVVFQERLGDLFGGADEA
jgi:hypothetical protein